MPAAKVIQVRFITPIDGQTEFYFGSVAAIYTVFTRDDLGIKESTLRNSKFPKRTNRCVISKFTMKRKEQKNPKSLGSNS